FFSSRRRHTRCLSDWSSDVCSSDLAFLYQRTISDGAETGASAAVVTLSSDLSAEAGRSAFDSVPALSAAVSVFNTVLRVYFIARSEERRVGKECRCRWVRESDRHGR